MEQRSAPVTNTGRTGCPEFRSHLGHCSVSAPGVWWEFGALQWCTLTWHRRVNWSEFNDLITLGQPLHLTTQLPSAFPLRHPQHRSYPPTHHRRSYLRLPGVWRNSNECQRVAFLCLGQFKTLNFSPTRRMWDHGGLRRPCAAGGGDTTRPRTFSFQ